MLDLGLPRAFGIATLTLAATLHAGAAHADPPAAPVAVAAAPAPASLPAAPVYRAPPGSGWPPGFSPAVEPLDVVYPQEMRARSSGMVAGGVVLLSFGMIGLIAGSSLVGAHATNDNAITPCEFCDLGPGGPGVLPVEKVPPGLKTAGIITLVGSVAALGAGTAFVVYGAKSVPVDGGALKSAALTPTVRVGLAGATLRWQF